VKYLGHNDKLCIKVKFAIH